MSYAAFYKIMNIRGVLSTHFRSGNSYLLYGCRICTSPNLPFWVLPYR